MQIIEQTLGDTLEHWAYETPGQEFMAYPDRELRFTYGEFNARVDALAKGLLYLGIHKGDKIGILARNIPDWTTLMFASAKMGAILVPINTNYKQVELEYLMKQADIKLLCLAQGTHETAELDLLHNLCPEIKEQPREHLRCKRFPELRNILFFGHRKHRGMYAIQELLLLGEHVDDIELESARGYVSCHDTTLMLYTSGTTGDPKGVMLSHYNILNNGYSVGQCMRFTASDRLLVCVPLFHSFGCILANCVVVTHGATLVFNEDFDPLLVLASVQKEKCTDLYGVPAMFIEELNHPMFEMFDLSSLRTGIMAGAPCPVNIMKKVMKEMNVREIISVYGLAEASPGVTATRSHNSAEIRATTIGFELPNVEVKLIDMATGKPCETNQQGEILCRGYNIMQGYYKNEEATKRAIDKEGWLHTGDLAYKSEDGFYRFAGILSDTINRGGESVFPSEVERYIAGMKQVDTIKVVGLPSTKYGQVVGAFVKVREKETLTEEDIVTFCKGKIAGFKIPEYIFFIEEFPKTHSGKIQSFKLSEMAEDLCQKKGIKII